MPSIVGECFHFTLLAIVVILYNIFMFGVGKLWSLSTQGLWFYLVVAAVILFVSEMSSPVGNKKESADQVLAEIWSHNLLVASWNCVPLRSHCCPSIFAQEITILENNIFGSKAFQVCVKHDGVGSAAKKVEEEEKILEQKTRKFSTNPKPRWHLSRADSIKKLLIFSS